MDSTWLSDGVVENPGVLLEHVGLHRAAVLGRFFYDRHIPDAGHGHVQGPWDGGGGEGQAVHFGKGLLEPFLLCHAEALLLVHNHQT